MNRLTLYRISSYVLLPVAALLGLATLFALLMALGNMAMLFSVFITGSTVIYIFASFVFLQKGIDRQAACKPSLRDWIKVNAYVAIFFATMGFFQGVVIITNPAATKEIIDHVAAMQSKSPYPADPDLMQKMMKGVLYFMMGLSLVLVFHIFTTFRLLKQNNQLFEKTGTPE